MGVEYSQSEYRGGHIFGHGTLYEGKDLRRNKTREEVIKEALDAAWSHGCPVPIYLTGPNSPYEPEWILERYIGTNKWSTLLLREARESNPHLYWYLSRSIKRLPEEPAGKHEPLSVPLQHLTHIARTDTPWGYAIPRILIAVLKLDANEAEMSETAYSLMADSIQESQTPRELLARLSDKVVLVGVEPVNVLEHVLSVGTLEEENCYTEYIRLAEALQRYAPDIMNAYIGLHSNEKANLGIAEIP